MSTQETRERLELLQGTLDLLILRTLVGSLLAVRRMRRSRVPWRSAMRSSDGSWVGIRPKYTLVWVGGQPK